MIIAAIGTPEAAAVVAPYLFDFTTIPDDGDMLASMTAISATLALGRMNLPGAPRPRKPDSYKTEDIIAWQQWAVTKGWVPKEWSAKVGAGETIRQLLQIERSALTQPNSASPAVITPPPVTSEAPPSVAPALPANPAAPTLKPSMEPKKAPIWPWAAGLVALGVILALIAKNRRS